MMDETIRSALRIAKADGGELNSLPEDAPVPRNPDEAARMLAEHRQKIYTAAQEPLKAEMEGITGSREWQEQQAEAINRQSFSPERMRGLAPEPQPIAAQREGLGLPSFNTPQQDNFEAQRAVEMARAVTNEENRKDLKAGLKQTWPVQMAEDVYMAARAPGDALYGKLDPNSDLAIKRMFDLAGATAMQAPIAMATKPDPSKIGIFGGAGARTADQSLLKQAQAATERGMAEQDIWRDTGWWKAPDGQWRFEIPDQSMQLTRTPRHNSEVPLATVVEHGQLFKAYPQLNDMRIKFENLGDGYQGFFEPSEVGPGKIVINRSLPPEQQRSVLAHELQHAVQRIEGFASGSNPREFNFPNDVRNRLYEEDFAIHQALKIQELAKEAGIDPTKATPKDLEFLAKDPRVVGDYELSPNALEYATADAERLRKVQSMVRDVRSLTSQNGYEGYKRVMGEVEARNVQERLGQHPNGENNLQVQMQRKVNKDTDPSLTQDTPADKQIYRSWDERMAAPAASAAPERQLSPIGLYSHGAETATLLPQPRGTPQQMKAMLERAGVKPDELKGFDEAFAGQKQITREQAAEFFNERMPKVEETVLGSLSVKITKENAAREWARSDDAIMGGRNWESLTPQEQADFIRGQKLSIDETKYSEYTLPGGENYREVLLRLPEKGEAEIAELSRRHNKLATEVHEKRLEVRQLPEGSEERNAAWSNISKLDAEIKEIEHKINTTKEPEVKFQSSHWDEPNVLAHIRMADRTGPKGERILHVEEMQSDWAQKGRKDGFTVDKPEEIQSISNKIGSGRQTDPTTFEWSDIQQALNEGRITEQEMEKFRQWYSSTADEHNVIGNLVARAPYVTNTQGWTDLALKRILKEAVDNGYQSVVWTPGAEQAKRYDLSKSVSSVAYSPELNGGNLVALDMDGRQVINRDNVPRDKLADYIGKETADKILKQQPVTVAEKPVYSLAGQELSVGGEGMRGYYDRIVPTQLQKLLKRIDPDAKITKQEVSTQDKKKIEHEQDIIRKLQEHNVELRAKVDGNPNAVLQSNFMQLIETNKYLIREKQKKLEELQRGTSMLSLQITPKLREAIKRGLPAFKDGGAVAPTDSQIAAGNYKKKHIRWAGMSIAIENEKGSTRSGTDKGGKRWSVKMPADYGYIKRTSGADGDHVDVYVGPRETSRKVFIVNQKDLSSGKFDEHKVMLGFNSLSEALGCYKAGFSDGKGAERASSIEQLSVNEFKQWLEHGDQKKVADNKALAKALSIASSIGPDAAQKAVHLASSKGA